MRISKKGEYALKAMIRLSMAYDDGPVRISDISKKEEIPERFLEQILLELNKAGLLRSSRGAGGGYSLIKPPAKISFAEVIRIIDGPIAPLNCVSKMAHVDCPDKKGCGLYAVMLEVRNTTAKILEGYSFARACSGSNAGHRKA
jgi:Rrf2 family cysteine metabolism transcriptional repressor